MLHILRTTKNFLAVRIVSRMYTRGTSTAAEQQHALHPICPIIPSLVVGVEGSS